MSTYMLVYIHSYIRYAIKRRSVVCATIDADAAAEISMSLTSLKIACIQYNNIRIKLYYIYVTGRYIL